MAFDRKDRSKGRPNPKNRHNFRKKSDKNKSRSFRKKTDEVSENTAIRLNRFIANAGICSRREADQLIENGEITINGELITKLGTRVNPGDKVKFNGRAINSEKPVYILLNKPKGFITTTSDPEDRRTVMDLVRGACKERIYPVGRLDRNTTGLLLLTNDGDLAKKLAHPSYQVKKIYEVGIDQPIKSSDLIQIREGLKLEDGFIKVDEIAVVSPDKQKLGIEIHSGRNRVIRRIFEHFNYKVTKLDRAVYANLTKKDLPRGRWRFLLQNEIIQLKHFSSGPRPNKKKTTPGE